MTRIRHFRLVTALVALFCVLFAQFAVAAYACPGMNTFQAVQSSVHSGHAMPGCHGMDTRQPALCQAHDQSGNQSLDKPDIPQVLPFIPSQIVAQLMPVDESGSIVAVSVPAPDMAHATAPPLAIRHCCFRN